jgi:GINS complex subunit 3
MLAVSSGPQFGGSPLVALDFPAPLQRRVVNALKADPKTVDLRAQAPQYYSLGAKILDLFEDEELADVLIEVCLLD